MDSTNVVPEVYNGMGRHIQVLTPEQGIGSLKVSSIHFVCGPN
jgi:hypothetical protein